MTDRKLLREELSEIFNSLNFGTDLSEEKGVARSLNCTNSEVPDTPPALSDDYNALHSKPNRRRAYKTPDKKRTYRPNPSFPAALMPEIQAKAADAQLSVGQYIVDVVIKALSSDGVDCHDHAINKKGHQINLTAEQWRALYGIANNLNQMTKRMHVTGELPPLLPMLLLALMSLLGLDKK